MIDNARIKWLEDGSPYSLDFNDVYYSSHGGDAESRHVFIEANQLQQRWQQHTCSHKPFTVVELGFGTGLNLLQCWQLLDQVNNSALRVHYQAFEKHPLTVDDLRRSLHQWPALNGLSEKLLAVYTDHSEGQHRYLLADRLTLDIYVGDALEGIEAVLDSGTAEVDCWFMDGFSPSKNPDLWSAQLTRQMAVLSKVGATTSSYSVAGALRRNLLAAGFTLTRLPGFGRKREMLLAQKAPQRSADGPAPTAPSSRRAPWFRFTPDRYQPRQATVVGGGLAGCSTAFSLSRKGWQVTLIEAADVIASGASGNAQAALQPRLAASCNPASRFYLHAMLYAARQYDWLQQQNDIGWHACGVLRLAGKRRRGTRLLVRQPQKYYDHRFLTPVSPQQANELAGLELAEESLESGVLWLPAGGWLQPEKLCQGYLNGIGESGLRLVTGHKVDKLQRSGKRWQVCSSGSVLSETPVVILANSYQAVSLRQAAHLPLTPVAGQLTEVAATPASARLQRVVAGDKYICPALAGRHNVGASYTAGSGPLDPSDCHDEENLAGVDAAFRHLELGNDRQARVSVRCNAEDYFPVVGPLPDYQDFVDVFAPLQRDAEARITRTARHLPGLFINAAHGSYGMASCPLSAELLASLVSGHIPPLAAALQESLSPARFIIRDLKKQRLKRRSFMAT